MVLDGIFIVNYMLTVQVYTHLTSVTVA